MFYAQKTLAKNSPQCFSSLRTKEIKHPTANGSLVSWNDPGLAPHCWAVFLAMSRSVWNGPSPIRPRKHGRWVVACVTWEETWSRFTPRNRRQKWFYHEAPTTKHPHVFFFFSVFSLLTFIGIFNDLHGLSQRCSFWGISGMVIFDLSIWFTIGDNCSIFGSWPESFGQCIGLTVYIGWNLGNWRSCDSRGENFCGLSKEV